MSTTTPPSTQSSERVQRLLAAVAVIPVLASVYQMLWTNVAWGVSTVYGVFAGLAWMARFGARSALTLGLAVFALGNLFCGAAVDVVTLSGAKLVEGIGKGMVIV